MRPDAAAFRDALSRFASGVTIVTTRCDGEPHGLTVSAFCSLTVEPPRVLVCLADTTESKPLVARSGVFAVHVLGRASARLGALFARSGTQSGDPFAGLRTSSAQTGSPILEDCLVWLDCRVEASYAAGDHTVFVGAVVALGRGADHSEPVVYCERSWRLLDSRPFEP